MTLDANEGKLYIGNSYTAVETIEAEDRAEKVIIDGQLYIIRNSVRYNAMGAIVK